MEAVGQVVDTPHPTSSATTNPHDTETCQTGKQHLVFRPETTSQAPQVQEAVPETSSPAPQVRENPSPFSHLPPPLLCPVIIYDKEDYVVLILVCVRILGRSH